MTYLAKFATQHPQMAYSGLGVLLQLELQYLQRTVPVVGSLIDLTESELREDFLTSLFGGEEVDDDLRKLLGNGVKQGGIGIPDPSNSGDQVMQRQWRHVKRLSSHFWGELA